MKQKADFSPKGFFLKRGQLLKITAGVRSNASFEEQLVNVFIVTKVCREGGQTLFTSLLHNVEFPEAPQPAVISSQVEK